MLYIAIRPSTGIPEVEEDGTIKKYACVPKNTYYVYVPQTAQVERLVHIWFLSVALTEKEASNFIAPMIRCSIVDLLKMMVQSPIYRT